MKMELIFEGEGQLDADTVVISAGDKAKVVLEVIAAKAGLVVEECFLFREDEEEPLDLEVVIDAKSTPGTVHHVHRVKKIAVTVNYQGGHKTASFSPATRVQRVLDWAVGPDGFKIDPAIAPEMELALHSQTKELPKQAHIGRYVRHPAHTLVLDLIRGVIPNGDT